MLKQCLIYTNRVNSAVNYIYLLKFNIRKKTVNMLVSRYTQSSDV